MKAVWVAVLALAAGAAVALADAPERCNDVDCPSYKVTKDFGNNVELRHYDASTWVATDVEESSLEKASAVGYARLFKYISGDNLLEQKYDMTAPMLSTIQLKQDKSLGDKYTEWFFLPTKPGTRPPGPRNPDVRIADIKEADVYTLSFGGWALSYRVKRLVNDFMEQLENEMGVHDFDKTKFYLAVYDPPHKIIHRHNEIFLLRSARKPSAVARKVGPTSTA